MPKAHTKKSVLPKHAPKRTGKRGPRPDDGEQLLEPPKQEQFPGMEDAAIEDLEDAARRYVGIRDQRMALTEKEVDHKGLLLQLMKRYDKTVYHRDGMTIRVVAKDETVKVKIESEEE